MKRMARLLTVVLATMIGGLVSWADDTWDGGAGAGSPSWSVDANWADDAAPNTGGGGIIAFNDTALGGTNVVDQDWTITSLKYQNASPGSAHTTVVANAKTLLISGGELAAGVNLAGTEVVIEGGTVQLGDAGNSTHLTVGYRSVSAVANYSGSVTLRSILDTEGLGTLRVGYGTTATADGSVNGSLDLSASTIYDGATADKFAADVLEVGSGDCENPTGTLLLPASLRDMELGAMTIADCRNQLDGYGTVDFGANSQLESLTVLGDFYLPKSGVAKLANWPTNVNVSIGLSATPSKMWVGCGNGADDAASGASLALTNGSLVAYLTSLRVGCSERSDRGKTTGLLDLSATSVRIGDVADRIEVAELWIGAGGGRSGTGTLRLPSAITQITCGSFAMGDGYSSQKGVGTLDFGANSQVAIFAVSNSFTLGDGGNATLMNWPSNVDVRVGLSGAPASMTVGCSDLADGCLGTLVLTNGSFTGYLTSLAVGRNAPWISSRGSTLGTLDLRETTLSALDVTGDAFIGSSDSGVDTSNYKGKGYVYLPSGTVNVAGGLYVGDTHSGSYGLVDVSNTVVTVGERLEVGPTGRIVNHVAGESGGIDFMNSDTNDFVITGGGLMEVSFDADPAEPGALYWGLRMAGDVVTFMQDLTNDPSRFSLDTSGLSARSMAVFGVHLSPSGFTYLGLPLPRGTLILIR